MSPRGGSRQIVIRHTTETGACTKQDLLGLAGSQGSDGPRIGPRCSHSEELNPLSHKTNPERDGFEPSWRVTPPTAFPESVRSPTDPVWDRLLNTLRPIGPTATDWLRLPIGIGVGITRGLWVDASPHRLPEPAVTSPIAREAGDGTGVAAPLGYRTTVEFPRERHFRDYARQTSSLR